jgi:hypothetical protein
MWQAFENSALFRNHRRQIFRPIKDQQMKLYSFYKLEYVG